jgi:hypothetical protein
MLPYAFSLFLLALPAISHAQEQPDSTQDKNDMRAITEGGAYTLDGERTGDSGAVSDSLGSAESTPGPVSSSRPPARGTGGRARKGTVKPA